MPRLFPLSAALILVALPATAVTVPPVTQEPAKTECSACHMAYPAGLMPARSWKAIISDLTHHFGEDASLDPETTKKIEAYYTEHAADRVGFGSFMRGMSADQTPLRITDMPWWKWAHKELNPAYFTSKRVKTKANCQACHQTGPQGYFEAD